ncbi:DUF2188 domain-containing protein [Bacillus sp. AK128]
MWNKQSYPDSMKNLMEPIRNKAIEIANALLDEGYEEGRAISIAIEKAKEWGGEQNSAHHVVPHESGWAVKAEHAEKPSNLFDTKNEALKKGQQIASNQKTRLIIHRKDGKIQKHQNFMLH